MQEAALQESVVEEEAQAVELDLERLHEASFGWALACCRWNRQEAEDVLQTAYLKAIEGRARFNGHSTVRTWFFGVVRHTAAERRRQQVVRSLALGRWLEKRPAASPAPSPELLTSETEAHERLRQALARLSGRQRELLHLVFYQELTVEEAADVLHISVGSARRHYARGKERLRAWLSGAGASK
jgi:RNA polymerase sigma-70 factor (ECF subfamily)